MMHTATEGAAQIKTTSVAGMCEEANLTLTAVDRATFQIGMFAQDGIERDLILSNKRTGAVVLVPIFAKREKLRDGYRKIARFSVKMLICFCISSSYSLDAKASRWRARIFYASAPKTAKRIRTIVQRIIN
jgi:hypothetical protein